MYILRGGEVYVDDDDNVDYDDNGDNVASILVITAIVVMMMTVTMKISMMAMKISMVYDNVDHCHTCAS